MNIIEHFCIDLRGTALAAHVRSRSQFHTKLAEGYKQEVERVSALERQASVENEVIHKGGNSNNSVTALENSVRTHEQKGRFFAFVAEHFVGEATYRLYREDLEQMEIAPTRY